MTKFSKGQSGNPAGRKKGSINRRTQLAKLLEVHGEKLVNKMVEMALEGDPACIKLCIERLIPKAKEESLTITFPKMSAEKLQQPVQALQEIINAISGSEIPVEQVNKIIPAIKMLQANYEPPLEDDPDIIMVREMLEEKYKRDY